MTTQIVNYTLEEAKKHNAKRVSEVHLLIGKLTFLGLEQVKFAYNLLVKNTILEDSKLQIEEKNGVVKCNNCGYSDDLKFEDDPVYRIPFPTLTCSKCEGVVTIVGGKECIIKSIQLVV
jgi:hydrogenase nickel incorporation protein HypA/HybF